MTAETGPIGGDLSHEFIILAILVKVKFMQIKNFEIDVNKFNFEKIFAKNERRIFILLCSY